MSEIIQEDREPLSSRVVARVNADFAEAERADVIAAIRTYGEESYQREGERVQIAILDLAKGDPLWFRHYLRAAKADYRDVLYWAYYYPKDKPSPRRNEPEQRLLPPWPE